MENNENKLILNPSVLADMGLRHTGMVRHGINEELRAIKRIILNTAFPRDGGPVRNRVMVTSVNEGEGKTFCALNLALSISLEKDKNVLLVDTNVLSPTLHKMVTPVPGIGLIDFLSEPTVLASDIIYHTEKSNLKIIPINENNEHANEWLASDDMLVLTDEFRERYKDRLVIFDAPPMLDVNETQVLAQNVDQIIIVVADGELKVSDLRELQSSLPSHVVVHYVLNKSLKRRDWKRG